MTSHHLEFIISGVVKWFDPSKGFGFIEPDEGGPDVLVHANVLRNYGVNSVSDGSQVEVIARRSEQGFQTVEVRSITPPSGANLEDSSMPIDELKRSELIPARIKWYSSRKGYGFANAYGHSGDIFIGASVLRNCGLAEVQDGEAVSLRIEHGGKGQIASHVLSWAAGQQQKPAHKTEQSCSNCKLQLV